MPSNFDNILQSIANQDVETLIKKDAEYGSSWKKRGGVGAFMMLARKWDRLETRVNESDLDSKYDIFEAITNDAEKSQKPAESTLETIRDLRRYLLLVESEILLRKQVDNYGGIPITPLTPPANGVLPAGYTPLQEEPNCPHCGRKPPLHTLTCPVAKQILARPPRQ